MELHIYTKKKPRGGSKATMGIININHCGHIGINVFLQRTLRLKPGDRVLIAKDTDNRNDWYLSFGTPEQEGYTIGYLRNNPEIGMVAAYNKSMIEDILTSVKAEKSASLFVATGNPSIKDGRTWYRILTANPKIIR